MAYDDIETEDMVIITVCTQYFGENSSSSSDESSEDSDDEALFIENSSYNDRKKGNTLNWFIC
jgi:hypothetical protein